MEHPAQPAMDAGITTAPAIVGNDRLDFLAANQLGRAMYSDLLLDPSAPPNFARHIFLDSSARRFYPNWDQAADLGVANLRTAAGKDPDDKRLHGLVGDLELAYESLDLRAEPGLTLTVYAAEPDSPTAHAISLLGSLAATKTEQSGMRQSGLATS